MGHALTVTPEELKRDISVAGREHLDGALSKGKGTIILSAHLGNFFLVGTRLAIEGYSPHVLVKPPHNEGIRMLLNDLRLRAGQRTIDSRPRRQAYRDLVKVLRRNELAIVIADEYRSGTGVDVSFFGHSVLARRGPATLALRTGAALVPVYLVRDSGRRLALIIEPEIELYRSGNIQEDVRVNTLRITQWLERVVRSYPDQWNWMNIRWQKHSQRAVIGRERRTEGLA
jgi:KDO2-lipid IV(A) lauroyltransferase